MSFVTILIIIPYHFFHYSLIRIFLLYVVSKSFWSLYLLWIFQASHVNDEVVWPQPDENNRMDDWAKRNIFFCSTLAMESLEGCLQTCKVQILIKLQSKSKHQWTSLTVPGSQPSWPDPWTIKLFTICFHTYVASIALYQARTLLQHLIIPGLPILLSNSRTHCPRNLRKAQRQIPPHRLHIRSNGSAYKPTC